MLIFPWLERGIITHRKVYDKGVSPAGQIGGGTKQS